MEDLLIISKSQLKGSKLESDWSLLQHLSSGWVEVIKNDLMNRICKYYKVKVDDFLSSSRKADAVKGRVIFCYLAYKVFNTNNATKRISTTSIGNMINRDHATVLHAIQKFKTLYETESKWRETIKKFLIKEYGEIVYTHFKTAILKDEVKIIA